MNPDNRLTVLFGLLDAEYLAESSGNDAEIGRMILIYRRLRVYQSATSYPGTITGEQNNVNQRFGKKCPSLQAN